MESPHPGRPQLGTGLPPGVEVGPLGSRLAAYLIDSIVPAVVGVGIGALLPTVSGSNQVALSLVSAVLIIGWLLFVFAGLTTRAASPGMRVMKLQLVGFLDGRPIGWGRVVLRWLVFTVVVGTGIGGLILLILLVMHPRRQGWHDLVVDAVMIKQRILAPRRAPAAPIQPAVSAQPDALSEPPAVADPADSAPVQAVPAQAAPVEAGPVHPKPVQEPVPGSPAAPARAASSPAVQSARPPDSGEGSWVATLDDGREVRVEGLVLLGRNPQPQPGEEDAQLIKLADETRTVSKSHLALGLDPAGLFVVDRGSTNGSTVTTPAGISTRCRAGEVVYVTEGSIVSIGDHWLKIGRS